jgi:hypothetical protein
MPLFHFGGTHTQAFPIHTRSFMVQNASLVAQTLQQQEILNHIIRVLARHNLLSEVELPRGGPAQQQASFPRPERTYGSAAVGDFGESGTASVVAVAAAANSGGMLSGGSATAAQMKWDTASPPVQVDVDEENFSAMLDTLDLPFSLDPPILC